MARPGEFIKNLQQRPYEERVKILWLSVLVIGVVLLGFWVVLMKLSLPAPTSNDQNFLAVIKENLKKTGQELKQTSFSPTTTETVEQGNPQGFQVLTVKDYREDKTGGTLAIDFQIANPGQNILIFLNTDRDNFNLLDGSKKLLSRRLSTDRNDPFPLKILSSQNIFGTVVFDYPQNQKVTLYASGLYFENNPQRTFNESIELDLAAEVKGATIIRLPRN